MKKIAIIGSGGAGKSTLSRKLGEMLNIPVYHLDTYFWKPGWVSINEEIFDAFLLELIKKDKWIIDGDYSRTFDIRFHEADTIIYLDMPRYITMYRIIKRRVMYHGKTRPDMAEGCQEKLDLEFVKWVWNFNKQKRTKVYNRLHSLEGEKEIIILKTPRAVSRFVKSLKN